MRRFFRAFRLAFWTALRQEASRRVPANVSTVTIHVDSDQAEAALMSLEQSLDRVSMKAEYVARMTGRLN